MTQIKRNIIANYAGSIWTALMGLAFVPVYIRFMGIEAYGLVGFFATLQSVFVLLDMGLSTTLNREMARLSVQADNEQEMRDLIYTLGLIYWMVALIIVLVVVSLSGYLAQSWVKTDQLSTGVVRQAVALMGVAMGLQWPVSFYSGGLMGLQRQVTLNIVNIVMATFRGVGAILILWLVSPTIQAFFSWQLVISGLQVFWLLIALWRSMPSSKKKACFKSSVLRRVWKFAAGMFGISALATLLTQTDKIILSRVLSLEMFGYYSLAGVVSMSLYRLIGPIFTGVYPRMTQLVSMKDDAALKDLYHRSCQMMSVIILPTAMVLSFFSKEVLLLWTDNLLLAEQTCRLVSLLVFGTALNGLMNLPYALQLAHGWTKLTFYVNLFSVLALVPMIFFMTKSYGAIGAASVWVILNVGYLLITIQLMHRQILTGEKWRWYFQDVGKPMLCSVLVAGLGRLLMIEFMSKSGLFAYIVLVSFLTLGASIWVSPIVREWLIQIVLKRNVSCDV